MIKIMNIENTEIKDILTRDINLETGVEDIVSGVIENVKINGDSALFEYCEKFDGAKLSSLEVSKEEIESRDKEIERFMDMQEDKSINHKNNGKISNCRQRIQLSPFPGNR